MDLIKPPRLILAPSDYFVHENKVSHIVLIGQAAQDFMSHGRALWRSYSHRSAAF